MEVPNIRCAGVRCRLRGALLVRPQRAPPRLLLGQCARGSHTGLALVLLIVLAQAGLASTYFYQNDYFYGHEEAEDDGSGTFEYFDYGGYDEYGYEPYAFEPYGYDFEAYEYEPYGYDFEADGRVGFQEAPAEAVTSRFHYVVPISVAGDVVCAGWMYRDNLVVTAAHCLPDPLELASLEVYVNRYDLADEDWDPSQTYGVTKAVSHPQYDPFTMKHDVAVLLLDGNAGAAHHILHANPANKYDIEEIGEDAHRYCYSGCELALIGWGQPQRTSRALTSYMQRGIVSFKENTECKAAYSSVREVSLDMVCTNAVTTTDSCAGSDGAPLVLADPGMGRDIIVGILSWGDSCTTPGKPAVFASMSDAKPFLEQMSLDLIEG